MTRRFVRREGGEKDGMSAHGVLERGGVFTPRYEQKTKELLDKYYPIEIDPTIPIEEKIPLMKEWYGQVHEMMLEEGVTAATIQKSVEKCDNIALREGIADLVAACQECSPPVPFVVMSAGLGNVIDEFLRQHLPFALKPSTMVVSNRLLFNAEGVHTGFTEPLMHMFNKSLASVPPEGEHLVRGKGHCLLLGDSVGDLTMADGGVGTFSQKLAVGFLNEKVEERRSQFVGPFDVVVTHDGQLPAFCLR